MKWEYKIVKIETTGSYSGGTVDEKEMLKTIHYWAKHDWELISALPLTQGSAFKGFGSTSNILLFFKRQKN